MKDFARGTIHEHQRGTIVIEGLREGFVWFHLMGTKQGYLESLQTFKNRLTDDD